MLIQTMLKKISSNGKIILSLFNHLFHRFPSSSEPRDMMQKLIKKQKVPERVREQIWLFKWGATG